MLGFLTPWVLAGLGTLAVPILVHLTQRERKDAVPFPSTMFLERVPYRAVRWQRIRHKLLFFLRCLALILIVLAFAHPFFTKQARAAHSAMTREGRDVVIVLDRSYSMTYGDRWQHALAAAKGVVAQLQHDDRGAVVYFAGTATLASPLTHDTHALLTAIDSVRPSAEITHYDATFRLIRHILSDTTQPHRQVVLISDFQRVGWGDNALPRLPSATTLTQINVGDDSTADVAIAQVNVQYDTSGGHERAAVEARVINRSATSITHYPVTFVLNGRDMQTQQVDCPAHGVATVTFDPVSTPPGTSRGIVRIAKDALEADNSFSFLVTRQPALSVLLIEPPDGSAVTGPYLTRALALGHQLSFHVRAIREGQLSQEVLRTASLVILDDAPVPSGTVGQQLVDYVRNGGGLLAVFGSHSRPDEWPTFADQLLPRPTGPVIDRVEDHGATLAYIDRGNAIFDIFNAPHSGDFSAARFFRYQSVHPGPQDRTLAQFDDGHPALLERQVGAGRVLAWTSDLGGSWNNFVVQPVFLPLIQEIAKYTAGYRAARQWMTVGDAVSLPTLFGGRTGGTAATTAQYVAISPSGNQIRFSTRPSESTTTAGQVTIVTPLELSEPGFYEVKRTGEAGDSTTTIAVNVDPAESDLTPLDTAVLTAAVAPSENSAPVHAAVSPMTPHELEHRQGVWWYLLAAALLLLGAETVISNRLSRGTSH
jgi:hypothetical protein